MRRKVRAMAELSMREVGKEEEGLWTTVGNEANQDKEEFRRMGVAASLVLELGRILRREGNKTLLYGGVSYDGRSMKVAQGAGESSLRKHYSFVKVL